MKKDFEDDIEDLRQEMHDESFSYILILMIFLIWNIIIIFAFWGGQPQEIYWKCKELQAKLSMQEAYIISIQDRMDVFSGNINNIYQKIDRIKEPIIQ